MPSLNAKSVIGGITNNSNSNSNSNSSTNNHFPQKLKNFFRINSSSDGNGEKNHDRHDKAEKNDKNEKSSSPFSIVTNNASSPGNNNNASKNSFRQSKFFSVGRLRSTTVASEGNILEESMSPTVLANPYFAHQGQPGIRHHNEDSEPPSPPDTPSLKVLAANGGGSPGAGSAAAAAAAAVGGTSAANGTNGERTTTGTKEELARKLRRVASAPNAQGLFKGVATSNEPMPSVRGGGLGFSSFVGGSGLNGAGGKDSDERPQTAELGKEPVVMSGKNVGLIDAKRMHGFGSSSLSGIPIQGSDAAAAAERDELGALPPPSRSPLAFRRTYSSNSIKVRNVEVGPQSFEKIKLIGKGDVGKVYLVREKKSSRLYAMKGMYCVESSRPFFSFFSCSL